MKIAHVTATFPPYFGGTGNVVFHNAEALARLGHEVTVYTASFEHAPAVSHDRFTVRRLRAPVRIGNAPLLPGLLQMEPTRIVHLHYPFIFGAEMTLILSRLKHRPYVLTYHNDLVSPGVKGRLFRAYERMWTRRVMRGARRVIVTSWDAAGASGVLAPLIRSDPARFVEIPNGVDASLFTPADGRSARDRLGVPGDVEHVLLFVGRMDSAHHPKGGVPVLLEALARLPAGRTWLLLAGGGDRVAEYQALAQRLGVASRVRFLGNVAHDELPAVYAAADLVVMPSQLFEPFGLVAIEAMACGRPVIASDLPGVRRVVTDAGGGVLARPGDPADLAGAIDRLLSDASLRQELGEAGRSGVETRYDWAGIALQLVDVYEDALGSPNGKA